MQLLIACTLLLGVSFSATDAAAYVGYPTPCPPVCEMACEYGNIRDENECPICECKPHPCAARFCGLGHSCVVVRPDYCIPGTEACDPYGECQPIDTQPSCQYGSPLPYHHCGRGGRPCPATHFCNIHPTDIYAVCCPKKPNPCLNYDCPRGTRCVVRTIPCLTPPCPEGPTCIPSYQ